MPTRAAAATMTASTLAAPGRFASKRIAIPEPQEGELLVQLEGCGVCASSLALWEGRPWFDYPQPPGAPGHEAWGRLDDGTRVAILTERGYAEWAVVPERAAVELPTELDGLPFPGEALGCATMIFRRACVRPGLRVAIVGMGFLGSAIGQLARAADADVVEVRRGTDIDSLAGTCDCAIETGGVQATLDRAARLLRVGGRLVVAGFHQDGLRSVDLGSWNWRALELVNAHERDELVVADAIRDAATLAANRTLDVERLVTHRFALPRIGEAFEAARARGDGFVKAVVES